MVLKTSEKLFVAVLFALGFFVSAVYATELQVSGIGCGGGSSSSTSFSFDGTICDNVAGTATSSSYILNAGFLPALFANTAPDAPTGLSATAGDSQVSLSWTAPSNTGGTPITDYLVEFSTDGANWSTFADGTGTATSATVTGLTNGVSYSFRVSAITSAGTGSASSVATGTPVAATTTSAPSSGGSSSGGGGGGGGGGSGDGGFGVRGGGGSSDVQLYEISWNLCDANIVRVVAGPPSIDLDVKIRTALSGTIPAQLAELQPDDNVLLFEANISQDETFILVQAEDIVGRSTQIDKQTINLNPCSGKVSVRDYTPTVSDIGLLAPELDSVPGESEPEIPVPAPFVDVTKDPQHYVDRYNNEPEYKKWFDRNYSQYDSIYHAVGLETPADFVSEPEPSEIPKPTPTVAVPFAEPIKDSQFYIDLYNNDPAYKSWFDRNFPYLTIDEAVLIQSSAGLANFVDPTKDPQYYIDRYYNEPIYKSWFDRNYPDMTIEDAVQYGQEHEKGLAAFVNPTKDPQYYIDRYYNEPIYKSWFDRNYPHLTIEEAVNIETIPTVADFVDPTKDPQHYINRYNTEDAYKSWFDRNYPQYSSIYHAVGLQEHVQEAEPEPVEPEPFELDVSAMLAVLVIVGALVVGFIVYNKLIVNRGGIRIGNVRWE